MPEEFTFKGLSEDQKKSAMRSSLLKIAEAVEDPTSGDLVFQKFLRLSKEYHTYSFANHCLVLGQLAAREQESRLVSSLSRFEKQARTLGHKLDGIWNKRPAAVVVKMGGSALWVWVPIPWSKEIVNEDGTTDIESGLSFKPGMVWRIEDLRFTDTEKDLSSEEEMIPQFTVKHEGVPFRELTKWAETEGIVIDVETILDGAAGYCSRIDGKITLRYGDDAGRAFGTLVHELAHHFLHNLKGAQEETTSSIREGEAQAVSGVVLNALGFDETDVSAGYIRRHGCKPDQIKASMERIFRTATKILNGILGKEE